MYTNVRRFLQFQVTVNVAALLITFISSFSDTSSPLTALQLLWINVIMDSFAALALATEPPNDKVLHKVPRDYARLITNRMRKHILIQGIYQCVALLGFFFVLESGAWDDAFNLPKLAMHEKIETSVRSDIIRSMVFNAFVFCQLFNEFNCRKVDDEINIFEGLKKAVLFVIIMVVTVVLQIVFIYIGFYIGAKLALGGLDWKQWLVSIFIGSISLPLGLLLRLIPVPADWSPEDDDDKEEGDAENDDDDASDDDPVAVEGQVLVDAAELAQLRAGCARAATDVMLLKKQMQPASSAAGGH